MIRQVVIPVGAAFLVLSAMTLVAGRHPAPRPGPPGPIRSTDDLLAFLRSVLVTAGGGYVMFLAMITVFSVGIVGDTGALVSAAWSGAFLASVSLPLLLAVLVVRSRREGRG